MKVFFAGSTLAGPDKKQVFSKIIDVLEDLDHEVINSWIVDELRENQTEKSSKEVLRDQVQLVGECDVVVVEASTPSFGIGFLIHQAIRDHKKILCLYDEEEDFSDLSDLIKGSTTALLTLSVYDERNLYSVIDSYISNVSTEQLRKFNFIASQQVVDLVSQAAEREGKSRSEFLRDLISSHLQ